LTIACAVGLLATFAAPSARANEWNHLTYFTFSAPVEIPGVALPAGTYMFKVPDVSTGQNVVQVFSKDGSRIFATFFTIPDDRMTPTEKPIVTFEEAPAGAPEAVKAWFYPGEAVGREFVYPKDQAERIAAATHQPVLATASMTTRQKPTTAQSAQHVASLSKSPVTRVDARGQTQAVHSEMSAHTAPMKSLTNTTTTTGSAGPTAATDRVAATTGNLPKTASTLPLFGLIGIGSLTLGLGAGVWRRRVR
jgi:hypothetical protein